MKKIVIVEDEKVIREELYALLENAGYGPVAVTDFVHTVPEILNSGADLVLLDINIPKMNGEQVLREIRQKSEIPVIMVTSRTEELDEVLSMSYGADDYITKPFNSREVVARIKAVLRRAGAQEKQEGRSRVEYDGLTIDMEEYQVVAFGQKMTFTAKEMELLWCLATNPGKAFSRNQLLETIWGYSYYGDTRTVDTHIKRIRQKLNIPENSKWDITTIWGVGYKFEVKSE